MLEETARVIRVEPGAVWVETQRRSTCSGCAVRQGCGTSALAKLLGQRSRHIRVLAEPGYRPGDEVVIGIQEQALVRGSLAVYLLPLLGLLAGALLGTLVAEREGADIAELAAILSGAAGFIAGLSGLRRFTRHIRTDRRYQPVVLRRILPTGTHPVLP